MKYFTCCFILIPFLLGAGCTAEKTLTNTDQPLVSDGYTPDETEQVCYYQNQMLYVGESYNDGCNTHICQRDGTVVSTELVCKIELDAVIKNNDSTKINFEKIATQDKANELALRFLPSDEWREVSQWLKLDNGNVWLLTRPIVTKGEPPQTNPCAAKNNCPVESWIIDPVNDQVFLSSSQNSYLAQIEVRAEPFDSNYLKIDWQILVGDLKPTNLDRTEYVSQANGSFRP